MTSPAYAWQSPSASHAGFQFLFRLSAFITEITTKLLIPDKDHPALGTGSLGGDNGFPFCSTGRTEEVFRGWARHQ